MQNKLLPSLLGTLLLSLSSLLNAAVTPGQSAPDFSFQDISGQSHTLAGFKGKTVVLEWTNPECPFVVHHYEKTDTLPKLQRELTAEGIVWVTVNSGRPGAQGDFEPAAVKAWVAKTGAAMTAYVRDQKGDFGRLFGAKATPHLFVIDANGVIAYAGAIDDARGFDVEKTKQATNYVRSTLAALKAGKPVSPASTQAYGCSVKY